MRTTILGIAFDPVTMNEALDRAMALLDSPGPHIAVTPNAEIVQRARQDSTLSAILARAHLVLPDGAGVILASRILGCPLKERVPGVDFALRLAEPIAKSGHRLFLLGAAPGVAEEAAARLTAAHPGLNICGVHHGYFEDPSSPAELIRRSEADVVFVCLGSPRQEKWMDRYGRETGAKLLIGLGGSLDVFAGRVKRAPALWQKAGMEWLYRALKEPVRLKRVVKLPLFLCAAVGARIKGK